MSSRPKTNSTQVKSAKAPAAQGNGKPDGKITLSPEAKAFIEKSSPEHGISLKDRVLIAVKDGAEHPAVDLLKRLKDQIPGTLHVTDASAPDAKATKAGQRDLVIGALELLRKAKRIDVRGLPDDGSWNDEATIRLVTPDRDKNFDIDSEFLHLLPPQTPSEVAELERRLLSEGCRDPLTTWKHGSKTYLVDGHTRLEICLRHGLPYKLVALDLPDRQAVIDWIWDYHYGRRNFTPQAESYRRGLRFNATKQGHGGDRKSKSQVETLKKAAKPLVATYKVSRATLFRDGEFADGLDRIVEACGERGDDFRRELLAGVIRLPRQKVLLLAKMTKAELVPLAKKVMEGEKIKLGTSKGKGVVRLALRRNNPGGQAKTLLESLGPKQAAELAEELNKLLQAENARKDDGGKKSEAEK
jgi:hypothetical protein